MTVPTQRPASSGAPPHPLSRVAARHLARARDAWLARQYDAAAQSLANVLALAPGHPEAVRLLGMVAQQRGDPVKAADCFQQVLPVWPDDSDLQVGIGIALFEQDRTDEAVTYLQRACELAPSSVLAWFNLGEAIARQARTGAAIDALQRALELDPSHVRARLSLARAHANAGNIEATVAGYRDVLKRDPENAEGWFGLSNLNTVHFDAQDIAQIRRAMQHDGHDDRDRELLGFTLAKAMEDHGEYAQAFDLFERYNASLRTRVQWDAAGEHKRVDAIRQAFASATPAPLDPGLGRELILIVSIPRSGSTLVEQVLASHSEVEGANEIRDMRQVIDEETARRQAEFPLWIPDATAHDWHRLGKEYLARTARWREAKPRFTDKSLVTWYCVGATLAMLPAARVVIVRRDPVETCLGCFRQLFSGASGFACDLDEMADYCADFLHLTRFWLEKYPSQVLDFPYEDLLDAPEAQIRRLLAFCDLPFEPACLDFHKTSRPVLSAPSAAQVRQPLRHDTARSARYGSKLDRLRARLRDAGVPVA